MTRPAALGWPVDVLRSVLRPAADDEGRAALEGHLGRPLLADAAADPRCARAVPVVAGLLRRLALLPRLAAGERRIAKVSLAWAEDRVRQARVVLAALAAASASAGVRTYLCKGTALHGLLYDDPSVRPCADVDALVRGTDAPALHAALLARGFVPDDDAADRLEAHARGHGRDPWLVDLGYRLPGTPVVLEVKADPVGIGLPLRRNEDLTVGGRASPAHDGLWIPSAETMLLQQAFSAARRPRPDLLAYAEIAGVLVRRRAELDVARALALLDGEGLGGILRGVLEEVERLFAGTVPAGLLRRRGRPAGFVPARVRRGMRGRTDRDTRLDHLAFWAAHGLGGRRRKDFARWIVRRAFPPEPLLSRWTRASGGRLSLLGRARRLLASGEGSPRSP